MIAQLRTIFAMRWAVVTFGVTALIMFTFLRIVSRWPVLKDFLVLPDVSLTRKMQVLWDYAIGALGDAPTYEIIVAFALPLAIALNMVVMIAFYRQKVAVLRARSVAISGVGLFLGIFGLGCFACSGLLIAPLLALVGLGGVIALLPFRGAEIGLTGVIILLFSSIFVLRQMARPRMCHSKKKE